MKPLLNQLGTLGIVTVVTVLVWLYAEDANIVEYTNQSVRLQFVVPEGSEGLITPSAPITVEVDFNSSNGQYQQFISATRGRTIEIDLPFKQDLDLEMIEVDIADQLQRYVFGDLGINLTRVSPDRVPVTFEKIVEVTLDVRIVQDTETIKLASAAFRDPEQPPSVTVRLPAGKAAEFVDADVIARVRPQDVEQLQNDGPKQITVPLEMPAGIKNVARSISAVDLIVALANDRDTVTIDRRPVLLTYPSSINERYIVAIDEADRIINAITLDGPRDLIAQLKADPNSPLVWATVKLTNEEVDAAAASGGELPKAVEIVAPPGVVPISDVVRVTIRVTPRSTTTTP